MREKIIRIYQRCDIAEIKEHLLIYGDISASCAKCNKIDLKLETKICPSCLTEFHYIAFRQVRSHMPKIIRLLQDSSNMQVVDYDDYKRNIGALKAEEFLK